LKLFFLLSFLMITSASSAQWHVEETFKYKINVPAGWNKNSSMEGSDKILDLTNPDGYIAIQIRTFEVDETVTAQQLANVFDKKLIAEGSIQLNMSDEYLNGIPGVKGVYNNSYGDTNMGIITFFFTRNLVGYLIFTVIPAGQFSIKTDEADLVLNTFTILPDNNYVNHLAGKHNKGKQRTVNQSIRIEDKSDNLKGSSSHSKQGFKQITIKSHQAYNFKTGRIENLTEFTGDGFMIFSRCGLDPEVGGKYIITSYSNFNDVSQWNRQALAKVQRHDRKILPMNKVCIYQLLDGSYARFMFTSALLDKELCNHTMTCKIQYPVN